MGGGRKKARVKEGCKDVATGLTVGRRGNNKVGATRSGGASRAPHTIHAKEAGEILRPRLSSSTVRTTPCPRRSGTRSR